MGLLAIWYHIGKKQNDFGQVWLALSILSWAFSGLVEIIPWENISSFPSLKEGLRSVFSLLNSWFILLALPWFRYLPKAFASLIKSKYWSYVIGVPFVFALIPTIRRMFSQEISVGITELDVYYALLTLVFLGFVLWESFTRRRLPLLGVLSLITVVVTLIAQVFKLFDDTLNLLLFSAIFKTALIMLFFALALSWVKELTETIIPGPGQLQLHFIKSTQNSTTKKIILLKCCPGNVTRQAELTPALHKLLRVFAERKFSSEEGWLEIKPKGFESSKKYDINDYNEIKRLIGCLLDGVYGKDNWAREIHFDAFKNALFEMSENRERKIRLLLPKSNIVLNP